MCRFGMNCMDPVGERICMAARAIMAGNTLIRIEYNGMTGVMERRSAGAMTIYAHIAVNFFLDSGSAYLEGLESRGFDLVIGIVNTAIIASSEPQHVGPGSQARGDDQVIPEPG